MTRYLLITQAFALTILLIYIAWWIFGHVIKPARGRQKASAWLNSPHKHQVYAFIHQLFNGVNAKAIANQVRRQTSGNTGQWVYGEIDFIGFGELFESLSPQSGEVFVDCGSGSGKAVFSVALLYPEIHAIGIELMDALYHLSVQQLERFDDLLKTQSHLPYQYNIQFFHQDMLTYDYSQATLLFINATCFSSYFIQQFCRQIEAMPSGSRVIITSQGLRSEQFTLQRECQVVMSWGMCRCFVYLKL